MIDELSIVKTDKVIHTVETDMVKLMVEIECFGMSFDEFDKETGSFDGLQSKQADLSCVHALNESHMHEIHVVSSKHEVDQCKTLITLRGSCGELDTQPSPPDEGVMVKLRSSANFMIIMANVPPNDPNVDTSAIVPAPANPEHAPAQPIEEDPEEEEEDLEEEEEDSKEEEEDLEEEEEDSEEEEEDSEEDPEEDPEKDPEEDPEEDP
ncbi:hypothetical protein Tco_1147498 [Tanacetum coccineum]